MWNDTHIGFHVCLPCPLPLPLSQLPSILHPFVRPSLTPLWGLNYAVIQRLASPHSHAARPPSSSAPLTRRSPGLTKSIEAEIARGVVADDVVCLCYVTMRMIPLQQRRKSRPLEAGQSMITYRICGGYRCSLQERIGAPLLDALLKMSRDPLLCPRANYSFLAAIWQLFIGG